MSLCQAFLGSEWERRPEFISSKGGQRDLRPVFSVLCLRDDDVLNNNIARGEATSPEMPFFTDTTREQSNSLMMLLNACPALATCTLVLYSSQIPMIILQALPEPVALPSKSAVVRLLIDMLICSTRPACR